MHRRSLILATFGLSALPVLSTFTVPRPARTTAAMRLPPESLDVDILRPEMFGPLDSPTNTTASLRLAFDAAISLRRPLALAGRYLVNGPLTANMTRPRAALDLRLEGDVAIEISPEAHSIEYLIIAASAGSDSHSISGGSLTIHCNRRVQRAISLVSNSDSPDAGGTVSIRAPVRVHDVHAPIGSNGVAYALTIYGPFTEVWIEAPSVIGVTRHPSFSEDGDCKGILVAQALGPVTIARPVIRNILNPHQDADGVFIKAPLVDGSPVGPLARIIDGLFEDCQGRSIKTQVAHTEVANTTFRRHGALSIRESCDVDTQYGTLEVVGWRAEYSSRNGISPLGRNHRPFYIQALYPNASRTSRVGRGELVTDAEMPNLVYVDVGPRSPDHAVTVENVRVTASADLAGSVFRDGLLGYDVDGVARSSRHFVFNVRAISGPRGLVPCACDPVVANRRPNIRVQIEDQTFSDR